MEIREATIKDIDTIESIYKIAREFMKQTGNGNQWKDNRPSMDTVMNDIRNHNFYVVEHEEKIVGVFAYITTGDPFYDYIEDGAWLNEKAYGVIHRIASSRKVKGVLNFVMDYVEQRESNIRIDTHADNKVMQHLLSKRGFTRCGIIYVDDGTPRLAYQKVVKEC